MRVNSWRWVLCMCALGAGSSCALETTAGHPQLEAGDEEAELLERIGLAGFDPATAVIMPDSISVEGDILLDREKLLAGEYEDDGEESGPEELIDKGYKRADGLKVSSANRGKIKLLTTSEIANGLPAIATAAWIAGESWSQGSSLSIKGSNTGPSITVRMTDNLPSSCNPTATAIACADAPSGGKPGANIWLKRNVLAGTKDCGWTGQIAASTVAHEMGHALGMMHPLGGPHISGTASCDGAMFLCQVGSAPYDTIMMMRGKPILDNCTVSPHPYLSDDDLLSASKLYPE